MIQNARYIANYKCYLPDVLLLFLAIYVLVSLEPHPVKKWSVHLIFICIAF